MENQEERQEERINSWPTNFWLVQALLIIIIAAAAFFAGRSSQPGEKPAPDATLDGRPPIGENAMVVAEARKLFDTAITAEGKWTVENQANFDRLIFNQPQPTRIKLSRTFVQLINTGKLKRFRPPGNQACPPSPLPGDPCADVRDKVPPPGTTGATGAVAPPADSPRGAR